MTPHLLGVKAKALPAAHKALCDVHTIPRPSTACPTEDTPQPTPQTPPVSPHIHPEASPLGLLMALFLLLTLHSPLPLYSLPGRSSRLPVWLLPHFHCLTLTLYGGLLDHPR